MISSDVARLILSYLRPIDLWLMRPYSPLTTHRVDQFEYDAGEQPNLFQERPNSLAADHDALAALAWNHFQRYLHRMYATTVRPPDLVGFGLARRAREQLSGQRAWAVVHTPASNRYSTNFLIGSQNEAIATSGELMRGSAGTGLTMYHGAAEYRHTTHEHAELRIGHTRYSERREQEQAQFPIAVNMAYCFFCAVQLGALGERLVLPYHNDRLAWYRFSQWILYFRSQRAQLWGPQVEAAYSGWRRDEREAFLRAMLFQTGRGQERKVREIQWRNTRWEGTWTAFIARFSNGCELCGGRVMVYADNHQNDPSNKPYDARCQRCGCYFGITSGRPASAAPTGTGRSRSRSPKRLRR